MSRECGGCNRYVTGEPWVQGRDCRICWLYHNDEKYRKHYDDPAHPQPPALPGIAHALAKKTGHDEKLIGDRLEDLFAAIGIPSCGACKDRKEWMNKAHRWLLNNLTQTASSPAHREPEE